MVDYVLKKVGDKPVVDPASLGEMGTQNQAVRTVGSCSVEEDS